MHQGRLFIERRDNQVNLYARLQERSIQMLQQLSGQAWSDFNPHDPGVTMLDILNYALFEVDYKLDFKFEEYLGARQGGELHTGRFGMVGAEAVFCDSIVTPIDYERLILDSGIAGIKDCRVSLDHGGLYLITIDTYPGADKQLVQTQAERIYHANRNLCENLGGIVFDTIKNRTDTPQTERPQIRPQQQPLNSAGMAWTEYRSVQLDFPDCYGINQKGLPAGATEEHRARIRQLKSYLLIFDYLMERTLIQAAGTSGIFGLDAPPPRPKLPSIALPGIGELIDRQRISSVRIEQEDFLQKQRSRYLDMLDIIYGEHTSALFTHCAKDLVEVNRMREELITQLPRLNAGRFRAFNLLDENPGSVSGVKLFISALTGSFQTAEIPLTNIFSRHNLKLVADKHFFARQDTMPNIEFVFDEPGHNWNPHDMETVPAMEVVYNRRAVYRLCRRIDLLRRGVLFESFLIYGSRPEHYRIVHLKQQNEYMLVFRHPKMRSWINLGLFHSSTDLAQTANVLHHFMASLLGECCSFYLFEHILFTAGGKDTVEDSDNYTLSVVAPCWLGELYNPAQFENLITQRLPAHLEVHFLWLHSDRIYTFERLYFPWKKALANRDGELAGKYAFEIRRFLKYNTSIG